MQAQPACRKIRFNNEIFNLTYEFIIIDIYAIFFEELIDSNLPSNV